LLGEEHPDTTIAAWNLFRTLEDIGADSAVKVLAENLHWLLERGPAGLAESQRQIRRMLADRLGRSTEA
jgi:hypothetical protein